MNVLAGSTIITEQKHSYPYGGYMILHLWSKKQLSIFCALSPPQKKRNKFSGNVWSQQPVWARACPSLSALSGVHFYGFGLMDQAWLPVFLEQDAFLCPNLDSAGYCWGPEHCGITDLPSASTFPPNFPLLSEATGSRTQCGIELKWLPIIGLHAVAIVWVMASCYWSWQWMYTLLIKGCWYRRS